MAQRSAYPEIPVDWMRASRTIRDSNDICPALLMAEAVTKYNVNNPGVNSYLYSLDVSLYTTFLEAENTSYLGITHFSNIPFVFNRATNFNTSNDLVALASEISGSWAQFAYDGRPTLQDNQLNHFTLSNWPAVTKNPAMDGGSIAVKVIGSNGERVVNVGLDLAPEDDYQEIGRRCAFCNSPEILAGIGV